MFFISSASLARYSSSFAFYFISSFASQNLSCIIIISTWRYVNSSVDSHIHTRKNDSLYTQRNTKKMLANRGNKTNKQTSEQIEKGKAHVYDECSSRKRPIEIEIERRNMAPIGIYCNSSRYFPLLFVVCYPTVEYYHHSNLCASVSVYMCVWWMV